eukprot:782647-Amphidinium_carterae.1
MCTSSIVSQLCTTTASSLPIVVISQKLQRRSIEDLKDHGHVDVNRRNEGGSTLTIEQELALCRLAGVVPRGQILQPNKTGKVLEIVVQ